jgi:hypothetical protein
MGLGVRLMMLNAIFNNIFFWLRKPEYPEKATDLSQVNDKLYHTYPLKLLVTSTLIEPLFLNNKVRIANPIATSAAATVKMKKTKICPSSLPKKYDSGTSKACGGL